MITLLLCILAGIIIGVIVKRKTRRDAIWGGIFGAIFGMLGGLMLIIILGISFPKKYVEVSKTELVAFDDNSALMGHFFLGSGSINENFYYFFCKKDVLGRIKFEKISAAYGKIFITEEDRSNGVLIKHKKKFLNKKDHLWGIIVNYELKYEIRIPKGSILRQFNLDLK